MSKKIVAVIPVREGSKRVKDKNFNIFYENKCLLEIKLNQLKNSSAFDNIYVSSDSDKAKEIASQQNVEFLHRDSMYCNDGPANHEIIDHIVKTIPGSPIVAFVLVTNPFFKRFDEAVKCYLNNKHNDSLVTVYSKKEFLLNKNGKPINYNFGPWHPFSQDLEPFYQITGGMFLAHKSTMQYLHYYIGLSPYLFETKLIESIDIDDKDQFTYAKMLAENIKGSIL